MSDIKKIKLPKYAAMALRADIAEINQLAQIRDAMIIRVDDRIHTNKRTTDALVLDAGEDPSAYVRYNIEEPDAQGDVYMTLTPLPTPLPTPLTPKPDPTGGA